MCETAQALEYPAVKTSATARYFLPSTSGRRKEDTIGVDVVAKEKLRHFIRDVNKKRGVRVLSSGNASA